MTDNMSQDNPGYQSDTLSKLTTFQKQRSFLKFFFKLNESLKQMIHPDAHRLQFKMKF